MCRFVLYVGPPVTLTSLLVEPTNSLIHQSFHSYECDDPLNGDGFGIAWYAPELSERPAVSRSMSPAWSNRNLLELSRVTRSGHILAHVRAATSGIPVGESNCHPFAYGRYSFMHNGDLGGFRQVRRKILASLSDPAFDAIGGVTDSEHLFAMFLDRMGCGAGLDAIAAGLAATIRDAVALTEESGVGEPSYLNLAVSDGNVAVASRFTTAPPQQAASLHFVAGRHYTCDGGVCRMVERSNSGGSVVVSSEPLSNDPGWQIVPPNHIVLVDQQRAVRVEALNVSVQ